MSDRIVYKIMTNDEFEAMRREGEFRGSLADIADGFIHMSSAAQVTETADKHFRGRADLAIAAVDLTRVGGAVRWEPSRGGQMFPHLYGVLRMDVVVAVQPLERAADGTVKLPG